MPAALALSLALFLVMPCALSAQAHNGAGTTPAPSVCLPVPASRGPAITFGHEGGNLRPRTFTVTADGTIRSGGATAASDSMAAIAPAAVRALARLARGGGFWTVPSPRIVRPPANPDAAREFIEVKLTCGSHRAEYVADGAPAAFADLFALLSVLVDGH